MTLREILEMTECGTNISICNANCTDEYCYFYDFDPDDDWGTVYRELGELLDYEVVGIGSSVDYDEMSDRTISFIEYWIDEV